MNRLAFAPGASIRLQGGHTFPGTLAFDPSDGGTPENPVSVGSYGRGRATIRARKEGVRVDDTAGVRIADLRIVATAAGAASSSGIAAVNAVPGDVKLPFLEIDRVEVSGFREYGVLVDGNNGKSGFRDVRITGVEAHQNLLGGIAVQGEFDPAADGYAHQDVYIGRSRAYENPGVPTTPEHTGDGIVISDVEDGTIEHSIAHHNGRLASGESGGPVGIWAWDADRVRIQHNVSYRNQVVGSSDGGGFDLDGGVTNSVMQYNHSHHNDGAGFLAVQFPRARPHTDNVIRHNTSQNDARQNGDGGIYLTAGVERLDVYGNEVFISPRRDGAVAAVAATELRGIRGASPVTTAVRIYDNRFQATGGAPVVDVDGEHPDLLFADNDYVSKAGPRRILWDGTSYRSVAEWRAETGQEPADGLPGGGDSSYIFWVAVTLLFLGAGVLRYAWRRRGRGAAASSSLS